MKAGERIEIGCKYWLRATKFDPIGCELADRHYSRKKIGSPQFMPPGESVVLIKRDLDAVFAWWRASPRSGIRPMNGLYGWMCTIFRNESDILSSTLILDAEVALGLVGVDCGPDGLMTYVWAAKIRSVNPGACFKHAGWKSTGFSKDGKKTLLQKPFDYPVRRRY